MSGGIGVKTLYSFSATGSDGDSMSIDHPRGARAGIVVAAAVAALLCALLLPPVRYCPGTV